jgi:hypothetical protein
MYWGAHVLLYIASRTWDRRLEEYRMLRLILLVERVLSGGAVCILDESKELLRRNRDGDTGP